MTITAQKQIPSEGENTVGPGEGAELQKGAAARKTAKAQKEAPDGWKLGDRALIVAVRGPMRHLHTNEEFSARPVKVEIDAFVALQLQAGKLAVAGD